MNAHPSIAVASSARLLPRAGALGLALWAALLAGCGLVPKAPLGVIDAPVAASAPGLGQALLPPLEVAEPEATALLDSRRIAVRDPAGQLAQLAGVALPDRAPRWLQARLLDALAARPFAAVVMPGAGFRSELRLVLRLQRFELDYREQPRAVVVLHAVLGETANGRVLASAGFERAEPVVGSGSAAGAEALQRAAVAAAEALADWATLHSGAVDSAP
jgi:ABC-type uncharacterized transport system auxiliary subunit